MKTILKIVFCYLAFLSLCAYAFDACSDPLAGIDTHHKFAPSHVDMYAPAAPTSERPHTYRVSHVTMPTMIVFTHPFVIRAHAPRSHAPHAYTVAPLPMQTVTHRGTLNGANVKVRAIHTVSAPAAYMHGDLPGAPQDLYGAKECETVGPRLDGSRVKICSGTVVSVIGSDGTVMDHPFTGGLE